MNVLIQRKTRKFGHDNSGSIAILFGLLVIPIVLSVALAVDYSRVQTAHRDLQQAVDSAAIAAAVYQMNKKAEWDTFTGNGKSIKQVAVDYVRENAASQHMNHIIPDARQNSSDNTLTVTAKATVPATFSRFVLSKFNIEVKATARMSGKTAKLCMMGLHRSAPEAVKAWGSAVLVAPDCAVVSNSEATNSLSVGGSASMSGEAFCSAGGVVGTAYDPPAQENCRAEPDPYANMYTQAALASQGLNVPGACNQTDKFVANHDVTFNAVGGVYTFCNGLTIRSKVTVTFGPGVYVVFKDLYINAQGTLRADQGTTIILGDQNWLPGTNDGVIYVNGGGNLFLTAPTTGPTASMALIQATNSEYNGDDDSGTTHTIIGGGTIEIVGNWYTPQSKVYMSGTGEINSNSNYFSLIADIVELEGNGLLTIRAGGEASAFGMTPIPNQMAYGRHISLVK